MKKAIGFLEVSNITRGILAADTMIKASNIQLYEASSVCPGKFFIVVAGDVGAVKSSVESGSHICSGAVVDKAILPNIHEAVFPALFATNHVAELKALGVIETYSVVSAIIAADVAAKAANVELIEVRLARGMGGKALVTLTGDVGSVKTAVEAGSNKALELGALLDNVVIPAPHKDLKSKIM